MIYAIKTARLVLQPFDLSDGDVLHGIFTNPHVREYLWDDEVIPRGQTDKILQINEKQFKSEHCGLWKILSDNQIIGFAGLWYFFDEPQPQLLYGLLPDFTGSGYATEASRAIVSYAFGELSYEYLVASTDGPHLVSQKVLERLGFALAETKIIDDKPTAFYQIKRPE